MTTKPPSGLAASGPADETDSEQITKEHSDEIEDIDVDPSDDVTVEATRRRHVGSGGRHTACLR